jgi:hypothetical protein
MNYKGRKARGDSTNGAVAAGNPTVIERAPVQVHLERIVPAFPR